MNILFVQTGNSGTTYWRGYNWWVAAHRTRKCGFHVLGWEKEQNGAAPWQMDINEPEHQPFLFGKMFAAGVEADAIVFGRLETRAALAAFYAMKDQFPHKPILSEIDDDIFDVAPYNPASLSLTPGSHLTQIAIDQFTNSDGLIVSTPYLKEVYAEFNDHIYIIPNSSDTQLWDSTRRKKKPGIRIGWVGSGSHSEDLELLDKVIPAVTEKYKEAVFVIVSYFGEGNEAVPKFLKNRPGVEIVSKWSPILKYPSHVAAQAFDIGLAPLVDNKFNRAKSNLRWLEYGSLGIPCVASRVGHFAQTIKDGVDGILVDQSGSEEATVKGWVDGISRLISDRKLRRKMGAAAHGRIANEFNVDRNLDLYISAVEDCFLRPAVSAPSLDNGIGEQEPELGPLEVIEEVPA